MRHRFVVRRSSKTVKGICVYQGGAVFFRIYAVVANSELFLDFCTHAHDVAIQDGLPISKDMLVSRGFPGC